MLCFSTRLNTADNQKVEFPLGGELAHSTQNDLQNISEIYRYQIAASATRERNRRQPQDSLLR